MWNSFKLTLVEPATIQRRGKFQEALEIAMKIEDEIQYDDDSHLMVTIEATTDSSYMRLNGYFFPIHIQVKRMIGQSIHSIAIMSFWRRDDGGCLIMLKQTNIPEDNPECGYPEALTKIIEVLKAKLA